MRSRTLGKSNKKDANLLGKIINECELLVRGLVSFTVIGGEKLLLASRRSATGTGGIK